MITSDISFGAGWGGLKAPGARADNLTTLTCQLFRNSDSLSFLEPQGPVQAHNGMALSCILFVLVTVSVSRVSKSMFC